MPNPNEKLAEALAILHELQGRSKRNVFKSEELTRTIRERLIATGFLAEVSKGWLYLTSPQARPGDTTPWIASFWEFVSAYGEDRYGAEWHLSPEQSLLLAVEDSIIPKQVTMHSPLAAGTTINLPQGSSIFNLRGRPIVLNDVEQIDGIRRLKLPVALTLQGQFAQCAAGIAASSFCLGGAWALARSGSHRCRGAFGRRLSSRGQGPDR